MGGVGARRTAKDAKIESQVIITDETLVWS